MAGPTLPRASEIGAPITCCGAWVIYSRLQRPQDAVYPLSKKDATGDEYDGDDHNYIIRFEKGQLPTAEAFWSLTMTIPTSSSCQTRSIATISPHCQPGRLGRAVSAGGFSRQGQGSELAACPEKGNSIWYCGSTGRGKRPPRSSMAAGRRRPCNARHESCNPL